MKCPDCGEPVSFSTFTMMVKENLAWVLCLECGSRVYRRATGATP